jgi:hypothetical protein
MVICKTYDEARLTAIEKISYFDCHITKITITYDNITNRWIVDNEDFDDDEWLVLCEK